MNRPGVMQLWAALALFVAGILVANVTDDDSAGNFVGGLLAWAGIAFAVAGVVQLVRAARARDDGRNP